MRKEHALVTNLKMEKIAEQNDAAQDSEEAITDKGT